MKEIRLGLEGNVDISKYAKSEFDDWQMRQIKLGLKANIDVSIYAKPEFNDYQMREIRLELLKESTLKQCAFFC